MEIIKSTFDTGNSSGLKKVFNAQNSTSESLKNLNEDFVITVTDILVYEDTINSFGSDQKGDVVVLFSEVDGVETLYGSVSKSVSESAQSLIDFMQMTEVDAVDVKVIKRVSNNGRDFISLQMV